MTENHPDAFIDLLCAVIEQARRDANRTDSRGVRGNCMDQRDAIEFLSYIRSEWAGYAPSQRPGAVIAGTTRWAPEKVGVI